ncbi:MAG: DUF1616 domain-containing protein [Candidatus Diapherotrites archaeon]|nr:DUF1616 domain-containing protein [Candidatus Diapherotrites archaeon]
MGVLELAVGTTILFAVLLVPGYFLSLAFFPKKEELALPERVVFSFAFSVAFMPFLMLLLNQVAGVPIDYVSSVGVALALVIIGLAGHVFRTKAVSVFPV